MNIRHGARTVLGGAALLPLLLTATARASDAGAVLPPPTSELEAVITETATPVDTPIRVRLRPNSTAYGVPYDCAPGHAGALKTADAHEHSSSAPHGAEDDAAPAETIWTRKTLFGDVGGTKTDLGELGIDFELRYSQVGQNVVDGGVSTGGHYGGVVDYILNVDGHKIGLWEGLHLNVHAVTRYGRDVLSNAGGITMPSSQMLYPEPGDYSDTNLTGFMAMQTLFDNKFAVLAGKLNAFDIISPMFPGTLDYGVEGFMNPNSTLSTVPYFRWIPLSMWGAGAWTLSDEGLPMTGLMAISDYNATTTNRHTRDSFENGVGFLGFHRIPYTWDNKAGYVYLSGGTSTKRYGNLDPGKWTVLPNQGLTNEGNKKKPWTASLYLYQVLWQEGGAEKPSVLRKAGERRIQYLFSSGYGDDNPSFYQWDIHNSVEGWGLIPGRPNDRMGIGAYYGHVGDDYRRTSSELGNPVRSIGGVEIYYNYEVTPWLHVTPDIQYAQAADRSDDPALILGLRVVMDLF